MRVLIVEDDPLFAEILQTFLDQRSYVSLLADTIEKAKERISSESFDFVLLDNHLPDGDGIHIIEYLKSFTPNGRRLPVIMLTGDDNQNHMVKAFDNGVDDFLRKPISLDLLWQKIQRVIKRYQKDAELEEKTQKISALLDQREQEDELARYVYQHVASLEPTETKHIDTYLQSSSSFNGDIFICESAPSGNRFVILADATGHGLAAAISILPLVTTIKAMIRKGFSLAHIVHEANKKLGIELPDDKFVALIGVEINFNTQEIFLFNGGMPDIVAINAAQQTTRHSSTTMALGILEPENFDPNLILLDATEVQHLFFFSDGLIEQENTQEESFGMHRVIELLERKDNQEGLLSFVVNHFTVFNEMCELQDDLSICDIQVDALLTMHRSKADEPMCKKAGKVCASFEIEGCFIGSADLLGLFDNLMKTVDVAGDVRQRAFTVFAELISNAIDHGILRLDSKLKTDHVGFAEYLMLKDERIENLSMNDTLKLNFEYLRPKNEISFEIIDSGQGYQRDKAKIQDDNALSGRGLSLIEKLCKSVKVTSTGNQTSVVIKREF